jgi:H+/Cl- antiporter ClcA
MAVGLAVSLRSPLMAVVMVPEMTGDLRLVLPSAMVVLAALGLQRVERLFRAGDLPAG